MEKNEKLKGKIKINLARTEEQMLPRFPAPPPRSFPEPPQSCKRSENSKSPNPEHPKEKKTFLF